MGAGSAQKQQQRKNMTEKFMSHSFKKVCSEPRRGDGSDELIKMAVTQNLELLNRLAGSKNHAWISNFTNVSALFFALSQLQDYYSGNAINDEQWALAGYYAFMHLQALDIELLNSEITSIP